MHLEKIQTPNDLKHLTINELDTLAFEIRERIIQVLSKKGGHLASSLGAVELCIALHYVLNTPKDSVIFDVGHQTYAHKILTGRNEKFATLREYNGISGFPCPNESPYDLFKTGHASTSVSYAAGMTEAKKLLNETTKTVAIIGDGSLSGGMCFEALNHCGHSSSDILVIYNHNEMSISPSVGALSTYLTKMISAPVYNRVITELETFLASFSFIKKFSQPAKKFEEALKGLLIPGIFFEELGFRYFGPIDGNNLEKLIPTLKNVLSLKGPRLLHILTKKGKGFLPAEKNPEDFHGSQPFEILTGKNTSKQKETFGDVFAKKLTLLAEKNEKITAITAAMPTGTSLNIFGQKFSKRLYDVGIAEGHAVGFASGLAKQGLKPFVCIYSTFLQRSYDQIIHDVALQKLPVTFILDRAGVVGEDGPTHHGVFDISFMRTIPNMISMAPKDSSELEEMIEFALLQDAPVSIRFPKGSSYNINKSPKITKPSFEILQEGKDLCVIALGAMVKIAIDASNILKVDNINIGLINGRFIKPLDEAILKTIPENYSTIITIEDGNLPGGFGSAILEFYEKENLLDKIKIKRIGFPDTFATHAKREELFSLYGLDSESLVKTIKSNI